MGAAHMWTLISTQSSTAFLSTREWMVVLVLAAPVLLLALAIWAAWSLTHREQVLPSAPTAVPAAIGIGRSVSAPRDGAEKIARERLARGEITAEEYERIISVLRD
jgi:uncharacterized membrane protein